MAATAVGCLWLLFRQGGPAAFVAGLATAVALAILLLWTGWAQRKGRAIGWPAFAAALVLTAIAATQVPRQPQAAARVPLGAEAWGEAAVAKYRAAGKPVFVYFTADWCLTCKANEAAAIEREATRDAFGKAGVKVLVGDWTNGDPAITPLPRKPGPRRRAALSLVRPGQRGTGRTSADTYAVDADRTRPKG
jgi:thiol:disulfide interchange protein